MKTIFNRALSALVIVSVFIFFNESLHATDNNNRKLAHRWERSSASSDDDSRNGALARVTGRVRRRAAPTTFEDPLANLSVEDPCAPPERQQSIVAAAVCWLFGLCKDDGQPVTLSRQARMEHAFIARQRRRRNEEWSDLTTLAGGSVGAATIGAICYNGYHHFFEHREAVATARGLAAELAGMEGIAQAGALSTFQDNMVGIGKSALKVAPYVIVGGVVIWLTHEIKKAFKDDTENALIRASIYGEQASDYLVEVLADIRDLKREVENMKPLIAGVNDICPDLETGIAAVVAAEADNRHIQDFNTAQIATLAAIFAEGLTERDRQGAAAAVMHQCDDRLGRDKPRKKKKKKKKKKTQRQNHGSDSGGEGTSQRRGNDDNPGPSAADNDNSDAGRSWRKPGTWLKGKKRKK